MNLLNVFGLKDEIINKELSLYGLPISESSIDNTILFANFLADEEFLSAYEMSIVRNSCFESSMRRFYAMGFDTHISLLKTLISLGTIEESIRTGSARFSERGKDGLPIDSLTSDHVIGQIFTIRGHTYGSDTVSQIISQPVPKDPFTNKELTRIEISELRELLISDGEKHLLDLRAQRNIPEGKHITPTRLRFDYDSEDESDQTAEYQNSPNHRTPPPFILSTATPPPHKQKQRGSF